MFIISLQKDKKIEIREFQHLNDEAIAKINFNVYIQKMLKIEPQSEIYEIVISNEGLLRASIDFKVVNANDAEIDFFALKFYSKKETTSKAILYFLDKINDFLSSDVQQNFKLIIQDYHSVGSLFFLIEKKHSTYYGFIDNENAHEPQPVGKIETKNLLKFLEVIKELV